MFRCFTESFETLDTMIVRIDDVKETRRIDSKSPRLMHLPRFAPRSTPIAMRVSFQIELLDSMIAEFANVDEALAIHRDVVGIAQLSLAVAVFSELKQKRRRFLFGIENLNPMIAGVGNPQSILFVDRHPLGPQKHPGIAPVSSDGTDKFSVGIEFLNAIKITILANVQIALGVFDDIG